MPREHPVYHIYAFVFMFCIANPQAFYSLPVQNAAASSAIYYVENACFDSKARD